MHLGKWISRALLLAAVAGLILMSYGFGAVVGKYRPELTRPYSDWAGALIFLSLDVGCSAEDVTTCGEAEPGPRQEVSCEQFSSGNPRDAVLFTFGQSNSANSGQSLYKAGSAVSNFNIHDGKCYTAEDPLLGADGGQGSVWGRVGDKLVESGAYDKVLIVAFGIGGTALEEWSVGGRLHPRIEFSARQLKAANIEPTHVLWHQGEADASLQTSSASYVQMFIEMIDALRGLGISAPVYPAVASVCGHSGSDAVREAQRSLPNLMEGVFSGPDTDTLTDMRQRHDNCHFTAIGLEAHAKLWVEALRPI